jgi:UDP-galactopyranose mutase
MKQYDYVIVGAGLFGAVFAHEVSKRGKKCLVIDKRKHMGGNTYCETIKGINVHKYGAHIFHTNKKEIWNYVNQFVTFNRYTNSPLAHYKGQVYNLPFNMNTFYQLWGTMTPAQAQEKIKQQVKESCIQEPQNLEEQALALVGKDIYEKLIKGYTEKQWGKKATELPSFIIKRLPIRYTFNNNYFNDAYQGIPEGGYNELIEKLLEGIEVRLETDFFIERDDLEAMAKKIVFTGMIDEYYGYCFGELEYRSLRFEEMILEEQNYQGNAVINYTEYEVPYTRIIEHKHFEEVQSDVTIITKEYPQVWEKGKEPYYPINNECNESKYKKYQELGNQKKNVIFGGRLGEYKYYDMDQVIEKALNIARQEV